MVTIESYNSKHLMPKENALRIDLGNMTLWFSYSTIVAFKKGKREKVIRENDWGHTTARHLNFIDRDKSKRISGIEFESQLIDTLMGVT